MTHISYDPEVEILSIRLSDEQSVDSDLEGDLVIDYDKNRNIVNLEIMNFDPKKILNLKK